MKYAVSQVGVQEDATWVLGKDAYFSSDGDDLPVEGSKHVWLGDVFGGPGVAARDDKCFIEFPLSTPPLQSLLQSLNCQMKHNFYPFANYGWHSHITAFPVIHFQVEL